MVSKLQIALVVFSCISYFVLTPVEGRNFDSHSQQPIANSPTSPLQVHNPQGHHYGNNGNNGHNGNHGNNGQHGHNGQNGNQGQNGHHGQNGHNGQNGQNGHN
ncbi:nacrein-like protein P1 [Diabrotica virgifera virgifera]|uniref:Nacrein-like protein P1 n=1 Tax=Diabrotica virgifera virgifera TaxID=50390 RepID=A0A6P7GJ89_DIAVI|nr:nacrein-like protein P1 [Diabrotica virgifera virgifera]